MKDQPTKSQIQSPQLEASLPDWCVLSWQHLVICGFFTLLFVTLNYFPLSVSTSWHDVWTGRWIASNGVYDVDPSIPLAEGTQHEVNGWLGRVIVHQTHSQGGLEFLSFLFAAVQTLVAAIWAFLFVRVSGRWWASLFPIAIMLGCYWHLDGISTRSFGQLCLALTALLVVNGMQKSNSPTQPKIQWSKASILRWIGVFLVMTAWINLDGSWVIGLSFLAILCLSQVILLFSDSNRSKSWTKDIEFRRRLVLFEIGLLATLLNPFGLNAWNSFFRYPDASFWHALGGWQPMQVIGWHGLILGLCIAFWLYASRKTTELEPWKWLVVGFALVIAGCSASMVTWTAPIVLLAAFVMLGHRVIAEAPLAVADPKLNETNSQSIESKPLRFAFTMLCGLVIWVGFTLSPASQIVLGGKGRSDRQLLGDANPVLAIQILQNDKSNGLLWCPSYWSDRLLAVGDVKQVFANLDDHRLPPQVRYDYETLYNGQPGWSKILDRYAVSKLLIDKIHQPRMLHNIRAKSEGWVKVHEDGQAVIFLRQNTGSDGSAS